VISYFIQKLEAFAFSLWLHSFFNCFCLQITQHSAALPDTVCAHLTQLGRSLECYFMSCNDLSLFVDSLGDTSEEPAVPK
jgi:hypothetical protein